MNSIEDKSTDSIEEYRKRIWKSKEKCRKLWAKLPFEQKIKESEEIAKFIIEFKKFTIIKG